MTPGRLIYLMVLATLLALAVVRQSAGLRQCGYRLEELRRESSERRAEHTAHRAHLSKLKNPQRILGLVNWLGLELRERPIVLAEVTPRPIETEQPVTAQADGLEAVAPVPLGEVGAGGAQAGARRSEQPSEVSVAAVRF
ncbi:MAG: hypothetical protein KAX19_08200 [Candidatus Brocadiae bacterium]|nr:hypothetical protein [Candidatus Brocadiia bacterium]